MKNPVRSTWNDRITRFDNLLLALAITESKRKKALLLLLYVFNEVRDIYSTLTNASQEYRVISNNYKQKDLSESRIFEKTISFWSQSNMIFSWEKRYNIDRLFIFCNSIGFHCKQFKHKQKWVTQRNKTSQKIRISLTRRNLWFKRKKL